MKDQCDNHCETCPMQTQIHCILVYAKATNQSVGALDERIRALESRAVQDAPNLLNPLETESEKLPALEVGAKEIQLQL